MDRPARRPLGQFVERLTGLVVMAGRFLQVAAVFLGRQQRKQGVDGRANVAGQPQLDPRPAAEVLGPEVDLCDTHALRVELAIGEVRAEDEQGVAIAHRVIA